MDAADRISIFDLDAYYGAAEAVKGVTIECPAHRVSAIIGPSWCGKSAASIGSMRRPPARAAGIVMLDDHDLYASDVNVTAVRRLIGMVFRKSETISDDVDLRERRVRTQTDPQ
jgi:phosphate transport system ATP-binding protein